MSAEPCLLSAGYMPGRKLALLRAMSPWTGEHGGQGPDPQAAGGGPCAAPHMRAGGWKVPRLAADRCHLRIIQFAARVTTWLRTVALRGHRRPTGSAAPLDEQSIG